MCSSGMNELDGEDGDAAGGSETVREQSSLRRNDDGPRRAGTVVYLDCGRPGCQWCWCSDSKPVVGPSTAPAHHARPVRPASSSLAAGGGVRAHRRRAGVTTAVVAPEHDARMAGHRLLRDQIRRWRWCRRQRWAPGGQHPVRAGRPARDEALDVRSALPARPARRLPSPRGVLSATRSPLRADLVARAA